MTFVQADINKVVEFQEDVGEQVGNHYVTYASAKTFGKLVWINLDGTIVVRCLRIHGPLLQVKANKVRLLTKEEHEQRAIDFS